MSAGAASLHRIEHDLKDFQSDHNSVKESLDPINEDWVLARVRRVGQIPAQSTALSLPGHEGAYGWSRRRIRLVAVSNPL